MMIHDATSPCSLPDDQDSECLGKTVLVRDGHVGSVHPPHGAIRRMVETSEAFSPPPIVQHSECDIRKSAKYGNGPSANRKMSLMIVF